MKAYQPQLDWIKTQHENMIALLVQWVSINSHSGNLEGLAEMLSVLKTAFLALNGTMRVIPLPPRKKINKKGQVQEEACGEALSISKHPEAAVRIFLGGHMDTVFAIDDPFQKAKWMDANTLQGPGAADMKGGLIVMLKALEALERSPWAGKIGWEIIINPDEEVGSPSSQTYIAETAKNCLLGLLFEPSFPDGSLVSSRKGSANFTAIAKGRAAHAGRDFQLGRNAIGALAQFIVSIEALSDLTRGVTVNTGQIEGGGPTNIVPALAICRFNVRVADPLDWPRFKTDLEGCVKEVHVKKGLSLEIHESVFRAVKPFDHQHQVLFNVMKTLAADLALELHWKPSGGICDGNILASMGVPSIDSLGVVGGNLHTPQEYVMVDSLVQRASLTAYFLMKLAQQGALLFQGAISQPKKPE